MNKPSIKGTSGEGAPQSGSPTTGTRGYLIVFEGLDGAGKTTQIELLAHRLRQKGLPVVVTSWNSSRLISKAIKRAKKAQLLTPYLYSTLHAADFMYRLENIIMPALQDGAVVIADRYAYTALARDLSRNVDRRWVESLYALAPKPDLAFYCTASVEESLGRIVDRNGGAPPSYYESGMDVLPHEDPNHSFREFQTRVAAEYERIRKEFGLIEIDAGASIPEVQDYVASVVEDRLKLRRRSEGHGDGSDDRPFARRGLRDNSATDAPLVSSTHTYPGRLVVIESADKHAAVRQANLLYNELLVQGYDVRLASAGTSWVATEVARKALMKTVLSLPTKVFLAAAEIALHYEEVILPALRSGALVIMDGYLASLYTSAVANGLDPDWFVPMFQIFHIKPDCTILLDVALRDVMRKKPLRPAANMFGSLTGDTGDDVSLQSKIIERYRLLAEAEGWCKAAPAGSEKELHQHILARVSEAVLPPLTCSPPDRSLREVLDLFSHYDHDFDHPRKVAELAVSVYDQLLNLHGYGDRERNLLLYAAMLHDIGHALSDTRHEEFTFEAIMRHNFVSISEHERELVANIAYLHRQPAAKLNFEHACRLDDSGQHCVKRLAAILRIADALDESGKRVVHDVRCYEEHGTLTIDLHAVAKALEERTAVSRKADLFELVYQKTVVVARNRLEKRIRDRKRQEAGQIGQRES